MNFFAASVCIVEQTELYPSFLFLVIAGRDKGDLRKVSIFGIIDAKQFYDGLQQEPQHLEPSVLGLISIFLTSGFVFLILIVGVPFSPV